MIPRLNCCSFEMKASGRVYPACQSTGTIIRNLGENWYINERSHAGRKMSLVIGADLGHGHVLGGTAAL